MPCCNASKHRNKNWKDVKRKNVVNNVNMSSLRAPWQKSYFAMNLTVVFKSIQKLLFISNFLTRFKKWWQYRQIKIIYSYFCFSCKLSKSIVTRQRRFVSVWQYGNKCSSLSTRTTSPVNSTATWLRAFAPSKYVISPDTDITQK